MAESAGRAILEENLPLAKTLEYLDEGISQGMPPHVSPCESILIRTQSVTYGDQHSQDQGAQGLVVMGTDSET